MTLINKCIKVITDPVNVWDGIKAETPSVKGSIVPFALIMAIIPAAFNLLGMLVAGVAQYAFSAVLITTILYYAAFAFMPLLVAFVISLLAPSFGGKKDLARACQLTYAAYVPAYIAGFFLFFTFTSINGLAVVGSLLSIYSLILLFLGGKKMLDVPQDKYVVLIIIALLVAGVVFWLVTYLVNQIAWNMIFNGMWGAAASALGGNLLLP